MIENYYKIITLFNYLKFAYSEETKVFLVEMFSKFFLAQVVVPLSILRNL